jgi:rubredoxin
MTTLLQDASQPATATNERWIRIPSKGYCPHCGLSRSHFFDLIKENKIRSVSLRKPGNIKGPRLVWLPSVFDYIESQEVL